MPDAHLQEVMHSKSKKLIFQNRHSPESLTPPTYLQSHGKNKIEDYWLKGVTIPLRLAITRRPGVRHG